MDPYLIDKPIGATPLEALGILRTLRPELADVKMSYAGRLDPMASGLLVALHGPLLHRQEDFWGLPKEYEATIALGIRSDSHDLLGIIECASTPLPGTDALLAAVQGLVGKQILAAPLLASSHVAGQLRRMVVSQIDVLGIDGHTLTQLRTDAERRIALVRGNFRQPEILASWQRAPDAPLSLLRLRIACSAGTYIRSLAHELGSRLGCGGVLADLRRTRVGTWSVDDQAVVRAILKT
jgi:tRNA pseudouridine55 synthase